MKNDLAKFAQKFAKLRQGGGANLGPAPHKPILLLTVIQGIQDGWIRENKIPLSPELVGTFRSLWSRRVTTNHSPLVAQPFFHMKNEGFWHHIACYGYENWVAVTKKCNSLSVLQKTVNYVELDKVLFDLLMSQNERDYLKHILLKTYFEKSKSVEEGKDFLSMVGEEILTENPSAYRQKMRDLEGALNKVGYEEERFVRGAMFKRELPLIYENTCCISRLRVETSIEASLVDACHIVPFAKSHDDTVSNGISLSPTLHRAFDRGLIAIDPNSFKVMISKHLHEPIQSPYSIRQFRGLKILLPQKEQYFPKPENFQNHLERFRANF